MASITITDTQRIKLADGTQIGELFYEGNTLKQIDIYPQYQNQGYGTEIIKTLADNFQSQGYSEMYVACITNPKLTHIMKNMGGTEVSNSNVPISPDPILERDKPNYKLSLPL